MTSPALTVTLPSEREIVMTRTFNAPARLLWEAYTKPEHVRRWWGPRRTNSTVCEIDLRVGGRWRWGIEDDGQEVVFYGEYQEIVPAERLVFTEIFEMFPDNPSLCALTFAEHDGRTTLRSVSTYESREVRDMVVATGMEEGAAESYDRLEEVAAALA